MAVTIETKVIYIECHSVIVTLHDVPNIDKMSKEELDEMVANDKKLANKLAKEKYLEGETHMESQDPWDNQDYEKGILGYSDHNYIH
jgi:hypothetical protein